MLDFRCRSVNDPTLYKMEQTHPLLMEYFILTTRYKIVLELLLRKIEKISSLQVVRNHVLGRSLAK